jgi:hypothetical protein
MAAINLFSKLSSLVIFTLKDVKKAAIMQKLIKCTIRFHASQQANYMQVLRKCCVEGNYIDIFNMA